MLFRRTRKPQDAGEPWGEAEATKSQFDCRCRRLENRVLRCDERLDVRALPVASPPRHTRFGA